MAESELSTVARPYARAAFSYALDQSGGLADWSRIFQLLAASINEEVVLAALDNPLSTRADKTNLLVSLVKDELSNEARNFISLLAEYGRLSLIPIVAEQFELLKSNHEKTLEVSVTSAFELSEENKRVLTDTLNKKLQRDINLDTEVDRLLIGGVLIRTQDTVIDDTIRGRLDKLAQALA